MIALLSKRYNVLARRRVNKEDRKGHGGNCCHRTEAGLVRIKGQKYMTFTIGIFVLFVCFGVFIFLRSFYDEDLQSKLGRLTYKSSCTEI